MKYTRGLLLAFILMICTFCVSAEEWTRPSFAKQEVMFASVVKESTVEAVIAAIDLSEEKGATGIDLHINYLNDEGLLTEENLAKICRSTTLPILAINYDSDLSQEERLASLLLAARAGCAAVDFPGFMYTTSSAKTHTAENIAYWEALGYDMSFIECEPSETVIDPAIVQMHKEYVDSVHALGAEVLRSFHVKTVFTAQETVAYLRFQDQIGADVLKLVGYGYTQDDVAECVEACKTLRDGDILNAKFSYHISNGVCSRITRVLCPVFYGSYIAFCYPELTPRQDANQLDLDMAMECFALYGKADKNVSVADAIVLLESTSSHPDLTKRITQYRNATTVGAAYGTSTDLSKRWLFDESTYSLQMRKSSSTTSYALRAYAYDSRQKQTDRVYVSATAAGDCVPYSSDTRVPKVGVYIGTEQKMLAFVYDAKTKIVDLAANNGETFTYDKSIKKDVLVSLNKVSVPAFTADVTKGENIQLGMEIAKGTLRLYAGVDALRLVATLPLTEELRDMMQANADGTYTAGVLVEMYMGNDSKGKDNTMTFTDVTYGKYFGDVNADGTVSVEDVLTLLSQLSPGTAEADWNGDGRTTLLDVLYVLKQCV